MSKKQPTTPAERAHAEVKQVIDLHTKGRERKYWLRELGIARDNNDIAEMQRIKNDVIAQHTPVYMQS